MSEGNNDSPLPLGEGRGVRVVGIKRNTNPYAQAALTYFHCSFSSVGAGITICAALVLLIIICSIPEEFRPLTFLFVVWNLIALSALFRYVKEQFANPRAHLMPEFRRVHATVGIVAMLIVAAVICDMDPVGRPRSLRSYRHHDLSRGHGVVVGDAFNTLAILGAALAFLRRGGGRRHEADGGLPGSPGFR